MSVIPDPTQDDFVACIDDPISIDPVLSWAVLPRCGAVVNFLGTVRDHAEGRSDVVAVDYEAYREQVEPKLAAVAASARLRWPDLGRLALVHRIGRLHVGEASVLVVASSGHRQQAFEVAQFAIDTVKATVPIWKHEHWAGGTDWGTGARPIVDISELPVR